MPAGSSGIAAAIAVCTSTVALSMSRSEIELQRDVGAAVPLRDVIESRPAMVVNWRSSGLATDDAIVHRIAARQARLTFSVG